MFFEEFYGGFIGLCSQSRGLFNGGFIGQCKFLYVAVKTLGRYPGEHPILAFEKNSSRALAPSQPQQTLAVTRTKGQNGTELVLTIPFSPSTSTTQKEAEKFDS